MIKLILSIFPIISILISLSTIILGVVLMPFQCHYINLLAFLLTFFTFILYYFRTKNDDIYYKNYHWLLMFNLGISLFMAYIRYGYFNHEYLNPFYLN